MSNKKSITETIWFFIYVCVYSVHCTILETNCFMALLRGGHATAVQITWLDCGQWLPPAPGVHSGQEIFGQLPLHGYTAGKSYSASSRGTRRARNIPPALGVHGEQEIFHQLKGYTAGKNYSASSRGTCRTRNISPAHSPGEHGRQELFCQLQGHTADKKYITKMKGVTPIQIKFFFLGGGSRKIRKNAQMLTKALCFKKMVHFVGIHLRDFPKTCENPQVEFWQVLGQTQKLIFFKLQSPHSFQMARSQPKKCRYCTLSKISFRFMKISCLACTPPLYALIFNHLGIWAMKFLQHYLWLLCDFRHHAEFKVCEKSRTTEQWM